MAGPPSLVGEPAVREIERHLRAREARRDALADASRALRRESQAVMARMHEGRSVGREVVAIARRARALAARIRSIAPEDGGLAHDALQESVEAILLDRVVREAPFPSPKALGVPPEAYLSGLGDLVGEVRRLALAALTTGDLGAARRHLATMESLYRTLCRFESPRSIVALKPKQDTARSLVERTRGEVALAGVLARAGGHGPVPSGDG